MQAMRALVTGATGFLGSHLCRRLIDEGYNITILRRLTSDLTILKGLNLNHAVGDITDGKVVDRAVKGQDMVIHAAAQVGRCLGDIQTRVNVEGTQNVVRACKKYNVKRLLHVSSIATIGIPSDPDHPADETFPFNFEKIDLNYNISKRRAEEEVRKESFDGLDTVIVNPGWIFGPFGNSFRGGELIDKVRRGRIVTYFLGGVNVVHVEDVVNGILSALKLGRNGERYILGGENVSFRQIAEVTAEYLGLRRIFIPIPSIITGLAAILLEPIGKLTGRHPPLTYDDHYYVNHFHFYDSGKAKKELGYDPRPFKEIVKEYLSGDYG